MSSPRCDVGQQHGPHPHTPASPHPSPNPPAPKLKTTTHRFLHQFVVEELPMEAGVEGLDRAGQHGLAELHGCGRGVGCGFLSRPPWSECLDRCGGLGGGGDGCGAAGSPLFSRPLPARLPCPLQDSPPSLECGCMGVSVSQCGRRRWVGGAWRDWEEARKGRRLKGVFLLASFGDGWMGLSRSGGGGGATVGMGHCEHNARGGGDRAGCQRKRRWMRQRRPKVA